MIQVEAAGTTGAISPAIDIVDVGFRYGSRQALDHLSFQVQSGEMFAILGPNGGGKSTLFRLLATLIPLQQGAVHILGHDVRRQLTDVRRQLGVVFQAPSLDRKLTAEENILHQAALYGLRSGVATARMNTLLEQLGISDRRRDRVEALSGGLRRRVELAKGMIHEPRLLLMDEPSTGLDPSARLDLWKYLQQLRSQRQMTIVLTTHLLDEADRADRIAILDAGKLVAIGPPQQLRAGLGGDTITVQTDDPVPLARQIQESWGIAPVVLPGALRLEQPDGHHWIARLMESFAPQIQSITVGKPTLEDVFVAKTQKAWQ